jgi:exonuclease V
MRILIYKKDFYCLLVTSTNGECIVKNPIAPKIVPSIKDDFADDELVAFAENLENLPPEISEKPAKKNPRPNNPLFKYRRGVLSVSDLSAQIWCEQQLTYKFLYPFILNDNGEIKRVDDKPHMLRGTSLHLERELEIQTKITIECQTREDSYGVRLLNMIQGIHGLLTWNKPNERYITREMPVRN